MAETTRDFGAVLRGWRQHRRLSQQELSLRSGISQRHISFLETGRARPSRPTLLGLAEVLTVPLRERNTLLQSAGFAPNYASDTLDSDQMDLFRHALEAALAQHEPFPAVVLDGHWNLAMANQGALRFLALFVDLGEALAAAGNPDRFQMIELCLHPAGLRPFILNWQELMGSFLDRARQALLANPADPHLPGLIARISNDPDAPANWQNPIWAGTPAPAVELVMQRPQDPQPYRLFTMLAHFGAARHLTLDELSLETFHPADAWTRQTLTDLV